MRLFGCHQKSVGEARRNPQHALVLARKAHGFPSPKARRTSAKVYSNIQDLAFGHPHKFSLRLLNLIVQTAQHIAMRAGMIVLYESFLNSRFGHGLLIVALEEKASIVAENARFKNEYSWQRNRNFLYMVHRAGEPRLHPS